MKFLWLAPRWPFPPNDGAKTASHALLKAVLAAGHEVHLISFARDGFAGVSDLPGLQLSPMIRLPRNKIWTLPWQALANLGAKLPLSVSPFSLHAIPWEAAQKACGDKRPSAVIVDGAHAFAAMVGSWPIPIIYRAHNSESDLWAQMIERSSFPIKQYFQLQAKLMQKFEDQVCRKSCGIAAISPMDAASFSLRHPEKKSLWVPVSFDFSTPPLLPPPTPLTLGFLGRMDWPPNRDGLTWFLKEVWPELKKRKNDIRLLVGGSGKAPWLSAFQGLPDVEFLGEVPMPSSFYEKIHGAVVPIRFGGGIKIKIAEAARFGRVSITTEVCRLSSGLSREAVVEADSPRSWVEAICRNSPSQLGHLGLNAYREAQELYSPQTALSRLLSLLP